MTHSEAVRRLREALGGAVSVIRSWHGTTGWDLYLNNAPEMRLIVTTIRDFDALPPEPACEHRGARFRGNDQWWCPDCGAFRCATGSDWWLPKAPQSPRPRYRDHPDEGVKCGACGQYINDPPKPPPAQTVDPVAALKRLEAHFDYCADHATDRGAKDAYRSAARSTADALERR